MLIASQLMMMCRLRRCDGYDGTVMMIDDSGAVLDMLMIFKNVVTIRIIISSIVKCLQ